MKYIYAIAVLPERKVHKIGFADNPWKRFKNIQIGNHCEIELALICKCDGTPADEVERNLHYQSARNLVRGEWYEVGHAEIAAELAKYGRVIFQPMTAVRMNPEVLAKVMLCHPRYQRPDE